MTHALLKRLESRPHALPGYSYKLAPGGGQFALDVAMIGPLEADESRKALMVPFADGNRRDGVGDLLEVQGIDCSRHRFNPIVLFDHGKAVTLPIAMAEDPVINEYTVCIDPQAKSAKALAFFYQGGGDRDYEHALFCDQVFDMACRKFLRGGSIGYTVIEARELPGDRLDGTPPGLHLIRTKMLELSVVVLPANQDTVTKAWRERDNSGALEAFFRERADAAREILCMRSIAGRPPSPMLVKSLSPIAGKKPAQSGAEGYHKAQGDKPRPRARRYEDMTPEEAAERVRQTKPYRDYDQLYGRDPEPTDPRPWDGHGKLPGPDSDLTPEYGGPPYTPEEQAQIDAENKGQKARRVPPRGGYVNLPDGSRRRAGSTLPGSPNHTTVYYPEDTDFDENGTPRGGYAEGVASVDSLKDDSGQSYTSKGQKATPRRGQIVVLPDGTRRRAGQTAHAEGRQSRVLTYPEDSQFHEDHIITPDRVGGNVYGVDLPELTFKDDSGEVHGDQSVPGSQLKDQGGLHDDPHYSPTDVPVNTRRSDEQARQRAIARSYQRDAEQGRRQEKPARLASEHVAASTPPVQNAPLSQERRSGWAGKDIDDDVIELNPEWEGLPAAPQPRRSQKQELDEVMEMINGPVELNPEHKAQDGEDEDIDDAEARRLYEEERANDRRSRIGRAIDRVGHLKPVQDMRRWRNAPSAADLPEPPNTELTTRDYNREWVEGLHEGQNSLKKIPPPEWKAGVGAIKDVRRKYRSANSLRKRLKKSSPGACLMVARRKDYEKLSDAATKCGVTVKVLGVQGDRMRVKLTGGDGPMDELANGFGVPGSFGNGMGKRVKSMDGINNMADGGPAGGQSVEPYGAQILRRIHEDYAQLMQDYDELIGPLENDAVKKHLISKLQVLERDMSEVEKLFGKHYKDLKPLDGMDDEDADTPAEEIGGVAKDEDDIEGAEAELEADELPDEDLEGLTDEEIAALALDDEAEAERLDDGMDDDPAGDGPARRAGSGGGLPKVPPEEAYEASTKRLKGKKSLPLRGKAGGVRRGGRPPVLQRGAMGDPTVKNPRMTLDKGMDETCQGCGQSPCACGDAGGQGDLDDKERSVVKEAQDFLTRLGQDDSVFDDEQRMEAYHLHKILSGIAGGIEDTLDDAESKDAGAGVDAGMGDAMSSHRKMCGKAAEYFKKITGDVIFGDPHRREAKIASDILKRVLGGGTLEDARDAAGEEQAAEINEFPGMTLEEQTGTGESPIEVEVDAFAGMETPEEEAAEGHTVSDADGPRKKKPEPGEVQEKGKAPVRKGKGLAATLIAQNRQVKQLAGQISALTDAIRKN